MTNLYYIVIFFILVLISCTIDKRFDKEKWLNNSDVNDTNNPRAFMTKDLLENYLIVGLPRDSIVALLGKPYKEGIENRLPKGLKIPDSLSFTNNENHKPENKNRALNRINEFMQLNSQPVTLMLYPIGWSTIDPNFLVIKFGKDGKADDFWIEQH